MEYRREIDGLRALAIIPVILFHAGFQAFSGGFVGVDIFFVISGYLITSRILLDKKNGIFSLKDFYYRRARRILPMLFAIMFFCLPFAWFWLVPDDSRDFFQSLIAATGFSANILFWWESGYFDAISEVKPLLHFWSLSVEEQYYLLFPIFLLSTWKLSKKLVILILLIVAIISFIIAQWTSITHPLFAFFLLPSRIWELLVGVFVGFFIASKKNSKFKKDALNELASVIGLMLIFVAVFFFDQYTPFPSFYALIPTMGAALIILFATNETLVGKLLSSRYFVGVGLISYSAYLWHQPIFAFARHRSVEFPSNFLLIILVITSVFLAYLSWKFIELPFRNKNKFTDQQIAIFCISCSFIFLVIGLTGHITAGFEKLYFQKLTSEQKNIYSFIKPDKNFISDVWLQGKCMLSADNTYKDFSIECQKIIPSKPTLLIWGDSHAASLAIGLREIHKNIIQYTVAACPPILDVFFKHGPNCSDTNDFVITEISRLRPNEIFLHANWHAAIYRKYALDKKLKLTIEKIIEASPKSRITIVGGVPQYPPNLPLIMLEKKLTLSPAERLRSPIYEDLIFIDNQLKHVAHNENVQFLSAIEAFCFRDLCQIVAELNGDFMPVVFDYGHLTKSGAVLLATKLLMKNNAHKNNGY